MKKLMTLILLAIGCIASAHAQGLPYRIYAGSSPASARICSFPSNGNPCTNFASVYADAAETIPISQPFTVQPAYQRVFLTAGTYELQVTGQPNSDADIVIGDANAGAPNTFQTNSVSNSSQSGLNFLNSTVNATGLRMTIANPSGLEEQMEIAGTLNFANLSVTASNIVGLFGSCSGVEYLGADNNCHAAGGSVTSIGLVTPSIFTVSGSPVTTAGTLTMGYSSGLTSNEGQLVGVNGSGTSGLFAPGTYTIPLYNGSFTVNDCVKVNSASPVTFGDAGAACGSGGGAFDNGLGTGYQDATEIAAPGNPVVGNDRLYLNSTTHVLSCLTPGGGSCMPAGASGLSGMTAGQVPIAATATTVTSSKVLAGSGVGITTGPTTSASGDCAEYTGSGGQISDAGAPCGAALPGEYTITSYGGVADLKTVSDGVSNGTTTITSATGLFAPGDVGKAIVIALAGTSNQPLVTTIATYVSATDITVSTAASSSATGEWISWGTDNTTALNNAISAAYSGGGGTVYFPAGGYLVTGDITLPNDGKSPVQNNKAIRIEGFSSTANGQWTMVGPAASVVDFAGIYGAGAATTAKIQTYGTGVLEIDHILFEDRADDHAPFVYTTNTTLKIHDMAFSGYEAGTLATNQGFIFGGSNATIGNGTNDAFQGYGTVISNVFFDQLSTIATFNELANDIIIRDNTVSKSCGNGTAFVIGSAATGNFFTGNLVEDSNYATAFEDLAGNNQFIGNDTWDSGPSTIGYELSNHDVLIVSKFDESIANLYTPLGGANQVIVLVTAAGSTTQNYDWMDNLTVPHLATTQLRTNSSSNTDLAGRITLASGAGSYSFSTTYTDDPVCVATDTTAAAAVKASTTTTTLTLAGTGTDVIAYVCVMQQ